MSEINLKSLLKAVPDYPQKDQLINVVANLQHKSIGFEKKYKKANNDKLIVSHLLSKVNEELEHALQNEKRFVASVSHELRTPLTAILGYSELLGDTTLNNKQTKYLEHIVQSSHHLLSLISDLLDVAKLEDSRIELSMRECDLDEILYECITLVQSRIAPDVELITDIPPLDYSIIADDKRLKQIFINLLTNAAKFTKKGFIKFYIKDIEEKDNNILRITVNVDDTGSGISKEVLSNLFNPFQSTDKTQGTGLGLYISQQLAYLMNGEITVKSKEGVGSSFSVAFEVNISTKKEIGKELKNANIIMLTEKNELAQNLSRDLSNVGANFQLHEINGEDLTSPIAQMIIGCKFQDIVIIDHNVFGRHTNDIAGTLKSIKPGIRLVALSDENVDISFSEFNLVLNYPINSNRVIRSLENIFSQEFFEQTEEIDYSDLDVLVVEDVDVNREYEKEMLDNFFSISCDTAVNGKEAVEMAKDKKYDIILMDIRMPVMDGLEATKRIREFDQETPIICMSANVYKEDKLEAEEAGMDDFIEKPLEKQDIEEKLNKYIKKHRNKESAHVNRSVVNEQQGSDFKEDIDLKQKVYEHLKNTFDENIAQRLFDKGLQSIKQYMQNIEQSFEDKDTESLSDNFHALKGVLVNLGLKGLSNTAGKLEEISQEGNIIEVDKLKTELFNHLNRLFDNSNEENES